MPSENLPADLLSLLLYHFSQLGTFDTRTIIGKIENIVSLDMIQIIGQFEYHLTAKLMGAFFDKNESTLLQVVKSFDATQEGIEKT